MKQMIEFAFSTSNFLLKEYFELRNILYYEGLGFNVTIDEYDIKSKHLFLLSDKKVVGGARIVIRQDGNLPMENNGFILSDYINISNFTDKQIGEISRISVINEIRSIDLLQDIFHILITKCLDIGVKVVLTIAPRHIARLTAIMCHKVNLNVKVVRNIPMNEKSLYKNLGEMNLVIISKTNEN